MLHALGLLSFVFVAWFTLRAYSGPDTGAGQSRRASIVEAWANICIGFTVNWLANFLLLPLVGASFTAWDNFLLGWIYTAVSIVRQYAIRRWFNARIHLLAARVAERLA